MRRLRVQLFLQRAQNVRNVLDVDDAAVRVEHLDEAAHVRAFEFLRQIHEHPDHGHRILNLARLVLDLDRKAQPAHADLVNAQFARVALILLIMHRRAEFFQFLRAPPDGFGAVFHKGKVTVFRNLAKCSLESQMPSGNFYRKYEAALQSHNVLLVLALFCFSSFATETFRVATYNVENYLDQPTESRHSVKSAEAKAKIRESIEAMKPDVVALEEMGTTNALGLELRASLKTDGQDFPFWEHVSKARTRTSTSPY